MAKILNILVEGKILCVSQVEMSLYKVENGQPVQPAINTFSFNGPTNPESIKNFFFKNYGLDLSRLLIIGIWEKIPKMYIPYDVVSFLHLRMCNFEPLVKSYTDTTGTPKKRSRINHG